MLEIPWLLFALSLALRSTASTDPAARRATASEAVLRSTGEAVAATGGYFVAALMAIASHNDECAECRHSWHVEA